MNKKISVSMLVFGIALLCGSSCAGSQAKDEALPRKLKGLGEVCTRSPECAGGAMCIKLRGDQEKVCRQSSVDYYLPVT